MLLRIYSDEWNFFRRTLFRTFLVLSVLCVVTITMSYDYYRRHPDKMRSKFSMLRNYTQEHDLAEKGGVKRCAKLFLNNLLASIQVTISGFVPFLFLPIVTVITSSMPAGLLIAANEALGMQGNFSFLLQKLVPHGIFEFVAMLYASSIGIYVTKQMSRKLISRYRLITLSFGNLCKQAARSFFFFVVPLLLIAAVVQTFVTPK